MKDSQMRLGRPVVCLLLSWISGRGTGNSSRLANFSLGGCANILIKFSPWQLSLHQSGIHGSISTATSRICSSTAPVRSEYEYQYVRVQLPVLQQPIHFLLLHKTRFRSIIIIIMKNIIIVIIISCG